ncbi:MAG: hypothetical protein K6E11_02160 [Bacilli bacterium]|nr:hypothetical protein [Bacilli bacterium]
MKNKKVLFTLLCMSTLVLSACGGKNKPEGDNTSGGSSSQDTSQDTSDDTPLTPESASLALVDAAKNIESYKGSYSLVKTESSSGMSSSTSTTKSGYKNPTGEYYEITQRNNNEIDRQKVIVNPHDSSYAILYRDNFSSDGSLEDTDFTKVAYHYGDSEYQITNLTIYPYEVETKIINNKDIFGKYYAIMFADEMEAGEMEHSNPVVTSSYSKIEGNKYSHKLSMSVELRSAGQVDQYPYYFLSNEYEYIYDSNYIYSYVSKMTMQMNMSSVSKMEMINTTDQKFSYEFDQATYDSIALQAEMPAVESMGAFYSTIYFSYKDVILASVPVEPGEPVLFNTLKSEFESKCENLTLSHLYYDEEKTDEFTSLTSIASYNLYLYPSFEVKSGSCEIEYQFSSKETNEAFVGKFTEEETAILVDIFGFNPAVNNNFNTQVEFVTKSNNFHIITSQGSFYYPNRKIDGVTSTSFAIDISGEENYHLIELSAEIVGDPAGYNESDAIDLINNAYAYEENNYLMYDLLSLGDNSRVYLKLDITRYTDWGGTFVLRQLNDDRTNNDTFEYGSDYSLDVYYYVGTTKHTMEFDGLDVSSVSDAKTAGATAIYFKISSTIESLRGLVSLYIY